MLKKTLDDILRISLRIAAATEECVERGPVRFAKSGERFRRRIIRLRLARLQHDGPMRRLERRTSLLQRSWNWFRRRLNILGRFVLRDKTNADFGKVCFFSVCLPCIDSAPVELRHLRYFVAVAEMENVSRAATQKL